MHRTSWRKYSVLAVVLGVALAAPAAAATPDAWITTKTTLALLTTEGVSGAAIKGDTWAGVVTLFGIVPSQQAKAAAADARKMTGVQRVENEELEYEGEASDEELEYEGEASDEELEYEVKQAFDTPNFKDITVEVRNGVVRLTGTVSSWAWRLEAAAAARAIPGVRAVEDELRLMLAV
jgi:osmotically-inducible protein OsmY